MNNQILKFSPIILIIFLFSGCSWQEYFMIINETNSEITIEYKIEKANGGFAIFDYNPAIYQLNSSGNVDWGKQLTINDKDTSLFVVNVVLPAKATLIFGHLSNDNYEKHDQYFINGRVFNLTNMSINYNGIITAITPENFDIYFIKKKGNIAYRVK